MLRRRAEGLSSMKVDGLLETGVFETLHLDKSLDKKLDKSLENSSKSNQGVTAQLAASLRDNRTIFVKLREGKVHFVSSTRNLYFVDSLDFPVSEMIKKVFKGLKQIPNINQCYLDQHSYFKGAFCIHLNTSQHDAVLVALRLQGIIIKVTKTAISRGV
ncbi:hypothetical protein OO007_15560 [Cocleimonas sp. KMM 6892]|uniref:hypothetical protein n=1 Tax=unclassified Cocleimonas TaxID=2639732 RepID=UPI002DBAC304|nr:MULTISPECIES: hypothetical protein [unclassified Cocleimonas]MEB8433656.1 hypothetical protein [Cocleimonas sp. KMM 6892]MEC4716467.1 hypothetical protein [Cocleimonas sp. KMM 6895]MEC4745640.1 hypothetical protein [Cocleimonas sp. KMM 6896]